MQDRPRALIVDDEDSVRQMLRLALADEGWELAEADSAESALALLGRESFDLLITDKNLPGKSGVDLVRQVREHNDAIAVIMMTSFGSVENALTMLDLNVSAYLEKPFEDIFAVARAARASIEQRRVGAKGGSAQAIGHFQRAARALGPVGKKDGGETAVAILVCWRSCFERDWLLRRIQRPGDNVVLVDDTRLAEQHIDERPFNLMIVDGSTHNPTVLEFLAAARTRQPAAACVVVADKPTLATVSRLISLDVRAVLERPLDERKVADRLDALLTRVRRSATTRPDQ